MSKSFTIDVKSSLMTELSTSQSICRIIDTPRALTVYLLIKYEEYSQLVNLEIDAVNYTSHQHFADDYLVTSLLKKSANLPLGIDKKQVALDAFYASEARCREYNDNARARNAMFNSVVHKARGIIARTLGPLSREDIDYVESRFRFGPGATTGVKGSGSVLSDKYDEEIHLTRSLMPFYRCIIGERWWEYKLNPTIVPGNRFTTVPKNAKTDRGICIEPTLNIYGQLGVGALLRRKMSVLGIDLSNQCKNQKLAKQAYDLKLATIDLSAASDSISWSVVMDLLPPRWFELLDLFRSPFTEVEGRLVENEKFSSMGNGYTFELESLIFGALSLACTPGYDHDKVSVYGDDIIVPQYAAAELIEALEFLGFSVNQSKSFLAGSFYESCGTDWFNGHSVRPFYLRQDPGNQIPYVVQIANALRLYAKRINGDVCCDIRFQELWVALYKAAPSIWRQCRVPAQLGDAGFIVSLDENHAFPARHCIEGWYVLQMVMKPKERRKTTLGRLLAALACPVSEVFTQGREPRRGYLGKPVPKRTLVSKWSDGFDWC